MSEDCKGGTLPLENIAVVLFDYGDGCFEELDLI